MNPGQVSIVIPYIDEADFLVEALASATAQQGISKEIIAVCNASIQPSFVQSLGLQFPDVKFIHEPVTGSAHARNAGLNVARGEWIQFLDVDDLLLPTKIKVQLAFPDADVIVSPHLFQWLNGKQKKSKWESNDVWAGLVNGYLGSTSSMLWRREPVLEVNGWNADYQSHQEYELLFRLLQKGKKLQQVDSAETVVRERKSGSITKETQSTRGVEGVNLRELMWMHMNENNLASPVRYNAFRQYVFRQLRGLYRINARETMEKYREYFSKKDFVPEMGGVPGYAWMYKTFGFAVTERLYSAYAKIRDTALPFLPKNKY